MDSNYFHRLMIWAVQCEEREPRDFLIKLFVVVEQKQFKMIIAYLVEMKSVRQNIPFKLYLMMKWVIWWNESGIYVLASAHVNNGTDCKCRTFRITNWISIMHSVH